MIEFKAECGHTVRARDEDAGGVVRCSYCGRNAPVPDNLNSEIDFLFRDVEESGEVDEAYNRRSRRIRKKKPRRRKGRGEGFDPFALVLKLCYVAALIIIVVVISRKFVIPLFDDDVRIDRIARNPSETKQAPPAKTRRTRTSQNQGPGLITMSKPNGLFVSSSPEGATVYCLEQSKAPETGRIAYENGVRTFTTIGVCPRLADGKYVVEVAFRWNDPHISNSRLSNYQNYLAFRRAITSASDEQRRQLMDEFFIPDDASNVFVEQTRDQYYLIRQYRNVTVRGGRSKGVHALFLPRLYIKENTSFSIEPLVTGYISNTRAYEFDETFVMDELAFFGVDQADRRFVIEALSRIGIIPYVTHNGETLLFKIGIYDGELVAPVIRKSTE